MKVFFKVVNLKKKLFLKIILYQSQYSNPDLSDFIMVNALKHETKNMSFCSQSPKQFSHLLNCEQKFSPNYPSLSPTHTHTHRNATPPTVL